MRIPWPDFRRRRLSGPAALQEIALHPKFATNGLIYFTYNKAGEVSPTNPQQRQSAIALARGKFDGKALTNVQELFVGNWNNGASGSRIAFGPDGFIYITTGAPFGEQAQDTNYRLRQGAASARRRHCASGQSVRRVNRDTGQKCSRWAIAINSASPSIRPTVPC